MTIQEVFQKYLPLLKKTSPTSHLDIEVLLCFVLGKNSAYIGAHPEYQLTPEEFILLEKFLERRLTSEPIAYIIGTKEFYGMNFSVNSDVLIPRPETEILVSHIIDYVESISEKTSTLLVDIGTGSGNIISSLAKNISHKNSSFVGVDISKKALSIANVNVQNHQLGEKIKLFYGDLLEPFKDKLDNYDHVIVVANLPYLPRNHKSRTPSDIAHEPSLALYADNQGFALYPQVLDQLLRENIAEFTVFFELLEKHIPLLKDYIQLHNLQLEQIPTSFTEPVFVKIEK